MNEEMKFEAAENVNEVMENCEVIPTTSTGSLGKKVAIGLGIAGGVAGIVALSRKLKGKFDGLLIKRLEKKGYTVLEPIPFEDAEINLDEKK